MLKEIMRKKKVRQAEVAKQLGVSQQLISFWCTGRYEPKISQLKPLSKLLNVDLETLVECFSQNEIKERRA